MPDIWVDVDAAVIVPVNLFPLIDDTDFKSIEIAIVYNSAGMALTWNFVTTAGAVSETAVTPTTGGDYDWSEPLADKGMYAIEIPASAGASINNNTEGFGWFTGVCTGVLPWRSPVIGFRAAALNNSNVDGTTIDVNVTAMAAGVVTAAAVATGAIDADAIADNAIDAGAIAADAITAAKIAAGAIDAATLASDMDTYQAKVVLLDDDTGTNDRYLVTFFKNGEPITSGITSPTIRVIKASDGTDLIAVTALSEIGSLGMYQKAEATNRVVDGSGYVAKVQATIASATRTWLQPIGRDS